jgi:NADH-quinone oxidoreductase subunit E
MIDVVMETDIKDRVSAILSHFNGNPDELIPILQEIQEQFGYLPAKAMQQAADFLHISDSNVFGVASFYALFKFVPTGKKMVKVCRGTACHVRGGARILSEVQKCLGIKPGESTADLEYSLETVACIGCCALAPTMTIDKETYGEMTTMKVAEIFGGKTKTS